MPFFSLIILFIYLFKAVLGLHCCTGFFSSCGEGGLLSGCSVRTSHCSGFSWCRAVAALGLGTSGWWAASPHTGWGGHTETDAASDGSGRTPSESICNCPGRHHQGWAWVRPWRPGVPIEHEQECWLMRKAVIPWQTNEEGVSPGWTCPVMNTTFCSAPSQTFSFSEL